MSIISFPDFCHVENIQTSGIVSEQVKLKRLDKHVQMIPAAYHHHYDHDEQIVSLKIVLLRVTAARALVILQTYKNS